MVELGVSLVFGDGGGDELAGREGKPLEFSFPLFHLVVLVDVVFHLQSDFRGLSLNHI